MTREKIYIYIFLAFYNKIGPYNEKNTVLSYTLIKYVTPVSTFYVKYAV